MPARPPPILHWASFGGVWDLIRIAFIPAFQTLGCRDCSLIGSEEGMWTELHVILLRVVLFLGFCSAHERHWFNGNPIHLQEAKRGRNTSALKIYKTLAFGHNQAELSYLTHTHVTQCILEQPSSFIYQLVKQASFIGLCHKELTVWIRKREGYMRRREIRERAQYTNCSRFVSYCGNWNELIPNAICSAMLQQQRHPHQRQPMPPTFSYRPRAVLVQVMPVFVTVYFQPPPACMF